MSNDESRMSREAAGASWNITGKERAIFTIIVMTGAFMAILDTTVVDVLVPKLTGPLSSDMYGVQWVITSYMLAAAVGLLFAENLIKRFGNKHIFLFGVAVFTAASWVCGISDTLEIMIVARVVQGIGEALIMVTSHVMIFSYFPPNKQGIAMGIFALGVSFAPSLGPTIGGYLTEHFTWRMAFFINIPVGLLLLVAGFTFLPDKDKRTALPFNFLSFVLLSAATTMLLIMLSKGQQLGWMNSRAIILLLFGALIAFVFYILSEWHSKHQLIDFTLFRSWDFANGILIYFIVLGFSMYQFFYLLPVYYEHIKMMPTFDAGLGVLAFAVFVGIFSPVAGVLSDKYGPKYVLVIAGVIYAASSLWLIPKLGYYTPFTEAMLLTVPLGVAMGMFFAPATVLLLQSAPEDKSELAIVIMDYFRFVGGSFGTAIATNNMEFFRFEYLENMHAVQNTTYVSQFLDKMQQTLHATQEQARAAWMQYEMLMASSYAFHDIFLNAGYWALFGSVFIALLFYPRKPKGVSS